MLYCAVFCSVVTTLKNARQTLDAFFLFLLCLNLNGEHALITLSPSPTSYATSLTTPCKVSYFCSHLTAFTFILTLPSPLPSLLLLSVGRIPFHAPKAAGPFVYRLFDQGSKEKNLITLGTSPLFTVKISDMEVTSNLKFCFEAFADKSYMKAVTQVQHTTVHHSLVSLVYSIV